MTKKKVKSSKKLMPAKEITVKSRTYGVHTRAARGSKTPVELNEALQANAAKTAVINNTAKRVHDLLKDCGKPFKEAMLWQVMLSRMRKVKSDDALLLLKALEGLELNSKYPLDRFVRVFAPSVEWNKSSCRIVLQRLMSPRIKSMDTEYLYELYLLTLGKDAGQDGMVSGRTSWIAKGVYPGDITFSFEVPDEMTYYVLCLQIMTGKNDKETGTLASRGMKVIGAGKV